jgi:two-component system KDP operon response regulator KdpE
MLTVRDQEEEKVEALDLGADDYVTKPFSTRELIARIRAAVRRVKAPARAEDAPIEIGEIRLGAAQAQSSPSAARPVHLTRKEFDILHCLMSRAGRVVTYAKLLTAVWGADCREEVEYLRTFVRQLRKKIEDDPSNPHVSADTTFTSATVLRMPRCYAIDLCLERLVGRKRSRSDRRNRPRFRPS